MQSRRRTAVQQERLRKAQGRVSRVSHLQRGLPRQARHRLYNSAIKPVAMYGTSYWGMAPSTIRKLRSQTAMVHGGTGRFKSTSLLCLVRPDGMADPSHDAHIAPISAWARTIWLQRLSPADLELALGGAVQKCGPLRDPWRHCSGPVQALVLTLGKLGWAASTHHTLLMDDGRTLDLALVPPCVVAREVRDAVDRATWREVAARSELPSLAKGSNLVGLRQVLRDSSLGSSQKASLMAIVTGAIPLPSEGQFLNQLHQEPRREPANRCNSKAKLKVKQSKFQKNKGCLGGQTSASRPLRQRTLPRTGALTVWRHTLTTPTCGGGALSRKNYDANTSTMPASLVQTACS